MATGGDNGERRDEAWRQVSLGLVSRIAVQSQRLAARIQQRVGALVSSLAGRQYLPAWLPDHAAFTSALWAERLVSRVYDTIDSLSGVPQEALPLRQEPSSFVWFRPSRAQAMLPDEDELVEAAEPPVIDTRPVPQPAGEAPPPATPRSAAPRPIARIRPIATHLPLGRGWDETLLFKPRLGPVPLQPVAAPRPPSPALAPEAIAQMPTPHPVSLWREDSEDITPSAPESTRSADALIPAVSEDSRTVGDKQWSEVPPLPHPAARADLTTPTPRTLPGVQRLTVFAHRILEARQRLLPRETPIARSAPQISTSTHALAAGEWSRPAYAEEPSRLPLTLFAPGTETAETGPPPGTRAHRAEDWLRPRPETARTPIPPEHARHIMDAAIPPGVTPPFRSPTPYDAAEIQWTYPDFAFPVPHGTEPPSTLEAYTSPPTPQSFSPTYRRGQPTWESLPEVAPPAPAGTPGIDLARGGDLTLTSTPGGRPPGTSAAPGLALAPLERPRSGTAAAPAAESTEGEVTGAEEETEEETEMNLDRLAREVYAILRRRLAWERERTLAQIT